MSPQSPGEQDTCGNILLLTIMNALYCIDVVSSDYVSLRTHHIRCLRYYCYLLRRRFRLGRAVRIRHA